MFSRFYRPPALGLPFCARLGKRKYRSEARMIFSANQSEGPSCTIRGKRLVLQVRNRNAEPKFLQKKRTTALSDSDLENVSTFENDNERKM